MSQVTGTLNFASAIVEGSTDGSNWTDWSGTISSINIDEGDRDSEWDKPLDGDTMIGDTGPRNKITITIRGYKTNSASGLYRVLRDRFRAHSNYYLRIKPEGGNATDEEILTSTEGVLTQLPIVREITGKSAGKQMFETKLEVADLVPTAAA
jgi:hypothetical protein